MMWSTADIADAVGEALHERAREDDLEQAVYGFDALDELGLHPLIHQALRRRDWGVWPEQRYPDDWIKRRRSEGQRCDVVLTEGGLPLRDPSVPVTLFDPEEAAEPSEAYWLEIKTVAQFEKTGPFPRYASELLAPVAMDLKKIAGDSVIRHGGLLLVLFTQDQRVAEHDLAAWHEHCLKRGYAVGPPATRGFAITDRIGNGWCAAAVFPVRG